MGKVITVWGSPGSGKIHVLLYSGQSPDPGQAESHHYQCR